MRVVSARNDLGRDITFTHHEGAAMVTAHDAGRTVGYITWWEPHTVMAAVDQNPRPTPYELQRIEVRPDYHRQGIASRMFEFAATVAPVRFSRAMTAAGRGWAASLGYTPADPVLVPSLGGEGLWNS